MKQTQSIEISKLIPHPANPNVMGKDKFKKLLANIGRTGLYEPIVVRPHPKKQDCFEIINGHHRAKALKEIGKAEADCVVWDVDDSQATILLTTLNRLGGSDEPGKKIELLKELSKKFSPAQLSKLLPNTKKQIEQLTALKINDVKIKTQIESFAIPLVFFVSKEQKEIIEKALALSGQRTADRKITNTKQRADALTQMANDFIGRKDNENKNTN